MAVLKYCCTALQKRIEQRCDVHKDVFDCPDNLICYIDKIDEYGLIIHDGGSSYICISYCPFCGSKLPDSKRDMWFDTLEELGFDSPLFQDIPKEFQTDEWWKKRKL
jgi:hypothetical protein